MLQLSGAGTISSVDPNFSSVVLLCHMDGADGSTTFTDQKGHTMNANGSVQIDTAQSRFGGSSCLFNGTTDVIGSVDTDDWWFGSGDFTIEAFVRFNSLSGDQCMVSQYSSQTANRSWWFRKLSTGNLAFQFHVNGDGTGTVILCSG